MVTVSVHFKVKNHPLWDGEDGFVRQSLDFETKDNPEGLREIMKLPEMLKGALAKTLETDLENITIISREDYESETEE